MTSDDVQDVTPTELRSPRRFRAPSQPLWTIATLGSLLVAMLSGIGLSMHYVPTPDAAHGSIRALQAEIPFGAALRSIHQWSLHATLIFLIGALATALFRGAYRRGGRFAWWSALALFLVVCAIGITGELLPWSRQAVTATEVRTGLLAQSPGIGGALKGIALGAPEVSAPTLTRFHALHTQLLPLLLLAVVVWRLRHLRRTAPPTPNGLGLTESVTFLASFAVVIWLGVRAPAPELGFVHVAGEAAFEARPEWHFLWLNGLIERAPAAMSTVAGVFVPGLLLLALVALPFLDRSTNRRLPHPAVSVIASIVAIAIAGLSAAQWSSLEEPEPTLRASLEWDPTVRTGYELVRREGCVECHVHEQDGLTLGDPEDDDWPTLIDLADADEEGMIEVLGFPPEEMPTYEHLDDEDARAIAAYVAWLEEERRRND